LLMAFDRLEAAERPTAGNAGHEAGMRHKPGSLRKSAVPV
jgi:hypothetical protein